MKDFHYAVRGLRRNPGFALVAILTLGLGIGANSAIFSVVNSVLLRPLPYPDGDRLVRIMMTRPAAVSPTGAELRSPVVFLGPQLAQLQAATRTLSHAAIAGPELVGLSGYEEGARLQGARLSASALPMLGVQPVLGRLFTADDERAGAPLVLIGAEAWRRYFGGAPDIIGRALTFDSVLGPRRQASYTVVGVLPAGLEYPRQGTEFWMTLTSPTPGGQPGTNGPVVGRLGDGISIEAANAELAPLIRRIREGARGNDVTEYEVVREQAEIVAPVRPALRVLTVAVVFLLLIACLNVANLLLARTAARQQEMAIRVALGAGRGRVVRLLVTESALLAGAGALAGIVLAYAGVWTLRLLATTANRFDLGTGTDFPRLAEISLDGTVLAFTALTAAAAGITLGLISALRYVIGDTAAALRTAARATGGFWRTRVRAAFLVAEIAAAMVLLIGGGLVLRSYANLVGVDSGYQATNVLTFQVGMPLTRYPDDRLKAFAESLVAEARRVPGIERAAYANQLPMVRLRDTAGGLWRTADPERGGAPDAPDARIVSTEYLDVMGIRVVSGRGFTSGDGEGAPKVLLLNEALARRDFAGQEPVGQLVYVGRDTEPWQIVGIVDDVRQMALDEAPQPQFFVDMRQWQMARGLLFPVGAYYAVRTTGDPMQAVAPIRELVERIDSETALFNVAPMTQLIETTVSRPRMYAVLLGIFAAVGVALAVIGIYGLMTYVVAQETRNFGIRMALGAQRSQVLAMVLRRSLLLAAAGVGVGVVAAGMLTSGLERMLFGVTPLDTETFAAMAVLFLVVAAMAALVPARRATRIDPAIALRAE